MENFGRLLQKQIEAEERAVKRLADTVGNPQLGPALERWLEKTQNRIDQMKDELEKP